MAIEVSNVILGPPSETPYDDLKDAILRRSQPRTAGRVTSLLPQQPAVPRLSEPLRICSRPSRENALELHASLEVSPPSYKSASAFTMTQQDEGRIKPHPSKDAVEFACAEEPQNIPEPSTHNLSTVHPGCLHLPSIILPSTRKQTESLPISPLTTRARTKPYCTTTESKYQFKSTCNTQWPVPFPGHQASEIAVSSPITAKRQLKPCGSAYLGLHHFRPPDKYRLFEAGRGLKACHAFMPRRHATPSCHAVTRRKSI